MTYVAEFVKISEEILRLRKHQVSFHLHLLQRLHEALQYNVKGMKYRKQFSNLHNSFSNFGNDGHNERRDMQEEFQAVISATHTKSNGTDNATGSADCSRKKGEVVFSSSLFLGNNGFLQNSQRGCHQRHTVYQSFTFACATILSTKLLWISNGAFALATWKLTAAQKFNDAKEWAS